MEKFIPKDKHDIQAVEECIRIGYPEIKPILPELLNWIQDMNWPVAQVLAPFLAENAEYIETEIRDILNGDDEIWKYWVMIEILGKSPQLQKNLQNELEKFANHPTESEQIEELDIIAKEILKKTNHVG